MRKLSLLAAAGLLAVPVVAQAQSLNELLAEKGAAAVPAAAKVYYQDGTRLEFPDAGFDMKMNLRLQALYTYSDLDGGPDTNDISPRNVRLEFEGHLLNKQFTYRIWDEIDNANDGNPHGLQDAWLEWNGCDTANLRFGQMKTPYGHQWMVENRNLQFIDRSVVTDTFAFGRQGGVMFHGAVGDVGYHSLGLFNGNSTFENAAEGQNVPGLDNRMFAVYNLSLDLVGKYDRAYEGDPYNTADLSAGIGASGYFGQGQMGGQPYVSGNDFKQYGAAVDLGLRGMGFSAQAEFYYQGVNFDQDIVTDKSKANAYGLYGQAGYFFVPKEWEVAGRFGWLTYDKDTRAAFNLPKDKYEINAVLGYYINGHNLKVLTGPSWLITKFDQASQTQDFRYQVGVFGYF